MKLLRMSHADIRHLRWSLDNGKKIAAIKVVRTGSGCTLVEAKEAVERYGKENNYPSYQMRSVDGFPRIIAVCSVKSIDIDFGDGTVTVDLEGMELKALRQIDSLGIQAVRDILDLVDTLKKFENGQRIDV